jgi:hypothetical protein
MALINARLDAQTADVADVVVVVAANFDTLVARRHRDAQRDAPRNDPNLDHLPPYPPHPLLGYPPHTHGPFFPTDHPLHVPSPRGQPHPYGLPHAVQGHYLFLGGPPPPFAGQHFSHVRRGARSGRWGRRPTIDPVVVGRAAHEATCFDKNALNRSMKMSVPTMGPNLDFKQWKKNFLTLLLSLKTPYLILQSAIRESSVWLDE